MAKCNACLGTIKPSINAHWVDNDTGERYHKRCIAGNCEICKEIVQIKNESKEAIPYYKDNPTGAVFHKSCFEGHPKIAQKFGRSVKLLPKQFRKGIAQTGRAITRGAQQIKQDVRGDWEHLQDSMRIGRRMDTQDFEMVRDALFPPRPTVSTPYGSYSVGRENPRENQALLLETAKAGIEGGKDIYATGKYLARTTREEMQKAKERQMAQRPNPKQKIWFAGKQLDWDGQTYDDDELEYLQRLIDTYRREGKKAAVIHEGGNHYFYSEELMNPAYQIKLPPVGFPVEPTLREGLPNPKLPYAKGVIPKDIEKQHPYSKILKSFKEQYGDEEGRNYFYAWLRGVSPKEPVPPAEFNPQYFTRPERAGYPIDSRNPEDVCVKCGKPSPEGLIGGYCEKCYFPEEENPISKHSKKRAKEIAKTERKKGLRARVMPVAGGLYGVFIDGVREVKVRIPKVPKKLKKRAKPPVKPKKKPKKKAAPVRKRKPKVEKEVEKAIRETVAPVKQELDRSELAKAIADTLREMTD